MIDKLPLIVFQKILTFLNYDDICKLKNISKTNKKLSENFSLSRVKFQFACPICILKKPFKSIGFEGDETRGDKLQKWVNIMNGNFFVQLKYLTTGNGNWNFEKDDDGFLISRRYKYFGQRIHINDTICPNSCDDLIKCLNNSSCQEIKNKKVVQDLAHIFQPNKIQIYKESDLYNHLIEHFKTDSSLPHIKTTKDLKSCLKNEFINSSTVNLKLFRINELQTETNILYEPYFGSIDFSEFESDLNRLVLIRYLNTREKFLEYDFDFNASYFKFEQIQDIHKIAFNVLRNLRFSKQPSEVVFQQIKYYQILNILIPNARHRLFS